jgi:hypothetical protein
MYIAAVSNDKSILILYLLKIFLKYFLFMLLTTSILSRNIFYLMKILTISRRDCSILFIGLFLKILGLWHDTSINFIFIFYLNWLWILMFLSLSSLLILIKDSLSNYWSVLCLTLLKIRGVWLTFCHNLARKMEFSYI